MKKINKKLVISTETIRELSSKELEGAAVVGGVSGEQCSIVYWCNTNTSIQRSCSSCP